MADIMGPLRPADSWSTTEVHTVSHNHVWTIKGFSQCECKYLETTAKLSNSQAGSSSSSVSSPSNPSTSLNDPATITFRIRLHPQGNKESNKDFTFFQCFSNTPTAASQFKAKFKFSVFNSRNEEAATTVYTGTQQLHGYFEYIRRDLLISHVQPQDELQLVLSINVTFDTITRTNQTVKIVALPSPKPAEVTRDLEMALRDNKHTDFTIIIGEQEIPVHKVILTARSPVFAAMLEPHTEEAQKGRVIIEEVDYEVMNELITYMYCGKSPNLTEHALEILAAADRFQLPGLKEMADMALRATLSIESACRQLIYADLFSSTELKREAIRYIVRNVTTVLQTDAWTELTKRHSALVTDVVSALAGAASPGTTCVEPKAESPAGLFDTPPSKRARTIE